MSKFDLFAEVASEERAPGGVCTVKKFLTEMPEELATQLAEVLKSGATHRAIARALTKNGYRIGDSTVKRHRRGDCACDE